MASRGSLSLFLGSYAGVTTAGVATLDVTMLADS
jgi:hypothetical protein